jgi:hypothetical protein
MQQASDRKASDGQREWAFEASFESPVKVKPSRFHGIEINDFACCVARTALWIAEKQADTDTQKVISRVYDEFPLTDYETIVEGNALRIDWNDVVPASECDYVMGNPPFIGHISRKKNPNLAEDIEYVWGRNIDADYVACWYKKAVEYFTHKQNGQFAFVSTNSITQGKQPPLVFEPLFSTGWTIAFAHRTFAWSSEANDKASVHVVIIGMRREDSAFKKCLYSYQSLHSSPILHTVDNINAYLLGAPSVFVKSRSNNKGPISPLLPCAYAGSMANDAGHLLINDEAEYQQAINDPIAAKYVRRFLMGDEFINGTKRWCLWMVDVTPEELLESAFLMDRVRAVREARQRSTRVSTREKLSKTPWLFGENHQPASRYLAIPRVFTERRRYTTCGWLSPDVIAGDKVYTCSDDSGFAFGIIESSVFMAWQRAVGGRMKSDPSFSNTIVWNNLPLPVISDDIRGRIADCGLALARAREEYPDSSLADMYDPDSSFLFPALDSAHHALDAAVEAAYGVDFGGDEEKIVAHLFKLYAEETKEER